MSWDRLKKSTPEEVVKGVAEKEDRPPMEKKESGGSSMKCPACGAMLSVSHKKEEA